MPPRRKLADAELHFARGPLDGPKLIGFAGSLVHNLLAHQGVTSVMHASFPQGLWRERNQAFGRQRALHRVLEIAERPLCPREGVQARSPQDRELYLHAVKNEARVGASTDGLLDVASWCS